MILYYHKFSAKVLLFLQLCKKIGKKYQKCDFFIKIIRIIEIFFVPLHRISIETHKYEPNYEPICIA